MKQNQELRKQNRELAECYEGLVVSYIAQHHYTYS